MSMMPASRRRDAATSTLFLNLHLPCHIPHSVMSLWLKGQSAMLLDSHAVCDEPPALIVDFGCTFASHAWVHTHLLS